jgi:hypothetical protein
MQTGAPFTVFNNQRDFSGFNQFNDRPDVVGTGRLHQDNRNIDAAFDKTYFSTTPPTGRVGTSGRNQYYGPGLQNYNFAVLKRFKFTEQVGLQFRSEFFNVFNHTNFANPQNNQSNANFGKITATVGSAIATAVGTTAGVTGGGPRVIQVPDFVPLCLCVSVSLCFSALYPNRISRLVKITQPRTKTRAP